MSSFIIPNSLQIVIDDLGWINGKDDRAEIKNPTARVGRHHRYSRRA